MYKSEQILDELNMKIQHLTSAQLRAESLLELLKIELKNAQELNIDQAINDTVAMVETLNKIDSIPTITFSIFLLEHFRKTNNFDAIGLPTPNVKKELERLEHLKSKLSEIVIIEPNEPTFH